MVQNNYLQFFLTILLIIIIGGCKTTHPRTKFVEPEERINWQSKIKSGEIAFYDNDRKVLANIDTPPEIKGEKGLERGIEISQQCLNYLVNNAQEEDGKDRVSEVAKIEFLVDEDGKTSNFYMLKSVDKCNNTLVKSLENATFKPASSNGKAMATLVHFTFEFNFVGEIHTKTTIN